jgi:hypothetical protein
LHPVSKPMKRTDIERYFAAALFFGVIVVFSLATRDEQRIRAAHEATQASRQLARQFAATDSSRHLQHTVSQAR